jgi:hypothetical protein
MFSYCSFSNNLLFYSQLRYVEGAAISFHRLDGVEDITQTFNFLCLSSANRNLAAKFPFQHAPVRSISLQTTVTLWQNLAYFAASSPPCVQFRLQEWHIDSRNMYFLVRKQSWKKQLSVSLCLSVCLPAGNHSVTAGEDFREVCVQKYY